MSPEAYKALHVIGLILLMFGLGGSLLAPADGKSRAAMVLHGLGALLLLVAGFGAMAKLGFGAPHTWPMWLILKMVIWVALAALPLLVRSGKLPRTLGWLVTLALGAAAAWLGATKTMF